MGNLTSGLNTSLSRGAQIRPQSGRQTKIKFLNLGFIFYRRSFPTQLPPLVMSKRPSTNATTCFKKHFGEAQKRHSNVRWHCEFEQCTQVGLGYPCLQPYMLECEQQGHSTESIKAMRAIVAADGQLLRCELAMNMDAFLPFVNATFVLEGSCALR